MVWAVQPSRPEALQSAGQGIIVSAMTATADRLDVGALPLAPKNPLPILKVLSAARVLHTGLVMLSEAGGPVTRFVPLPKFLAPALVLVTSPNGVRDVLGRTDGLTERCQIHQEVRNVAGDNLFCPAQQGMGSAPTRTTTGIHQTQRRRLRQAHDAGGANVRRSLARSR